MSSNKKKMAQYMKEELLNIAKSHIIKVEPSLDFEKASKNIFDKANKAIQDKVDELFPNKEDINILLKYKVAYRLDNIYYNGYNFILNKDVPNTFQKWDLNDIIKEYVFQLDVLKTRIKKIIKEKLIPYSNLVNSCNYLEDVATLWDNEDVIKYIENNTKRVLKSNSLTVFTEEDKIKLDEIERKLKNVEKDN